MEKARGFTQLFREVFQELGVHTELIDRVPVCRCEMGPEGHIIITIKIRASDTTSELYAITTLKVKTSIDSYDEHSERLKDAPYSFLPRALDLRLLQTRLPSTRQDLCLQVMLGQYILHPRIGTSWRWRQRIGAIVTTWCSKPTRHSWFRSRR
ncbi:hypothetical protein SORBI_3005G163932 [Sorghum bicolor]|jgi:hypothetical protein|uniref:Uncharacterized protein n=1 Tax=Sorghum bicolor TaxID=4558 RepID=A0A1Z5RIW1_SORBI|nr:hypothetical protein SORBI_3005G163932 [Sorghum bicolor]